jgi:phosphoribosylformylglycinamidine synthase
MIHFFGKPENKVIAVQSLDKLSPETLTKLIWLFGDQQKLNMALLERIN